jgi:hypothetical protein
VWGLVAVKRLLTARRCRVSGSSDAVTECKRVVVRCGDVFSSQADYSLWRAARWWVTLETPQRECPGMAARKRKGESFGGAVAFGFSVFVVFGIVEWFYRVVLPVVLWWAWALTAAALIAAPFVFGAYMRSPWGGERIRDGTRVQCLSLLNLAVFLFDQSRKAGWTSLGESLAVSIIVSVGVFVVAVAMERAAQWLLRRILGWVEAERAKGARNEESTVAGSAGDVRRALSVFGLSEPVALDTLKARYRRLVVTVHPDKGGSAARFRVVQEAYEVLVRVAER